MSSHLVGREGSIPLTAHSLAICLRSVSLHVTMRTLPAPIHSPRAPSTSPSGRAYATSSLPMPVILRTFPETPGARVGLTMWLNSPATVPPASTFTAPTSMISVVRPPFLRFLGT